MSLILEALRKSEAERQRDSAPSVAMELPPVPARGPGATPGWVWPTLTALVAVALLAGWLGLRSGKHDRTINVAPSEHVAATEDQSRMPPQPSITPEERPVVASTTGTSSMPAPTPVLERTPPTAPAPNPRLTAVEARAPTTEHAAPIPMPPAPLHLEPPPAARPPAITAAAGANDAPPISATSLPPVKLSMHMWDTDPAQRFVILNGQRMVEGDRSGGLQVIEIRRDGVIIERDGLRARVPLP